MCTIICHQYLASIVTRETMLWFSRSAVHIKKWSQIPLTPLECNSSLGYLSSFFLFIGEAGCNVILAMFQEMNRSREAEHSSAINVSWEQQREKEMLSMCHHYFSRKGLSYLETLKPENSNADQKKHSPAFWHHIYLDKKLTNLDIQTLNLEKGKQECGST